MMSSQYSTLLITGRYCCATDDKKVPCPQCLFEGWRRGQALPTPAIIPLPVYPKIVTTHVRASCPCCQVHTEASLPEIARDRCVRGARLHLKRFDLGQSRYFTPSWCILRTFAKCIFLNARATTPQEESNYLGMKVSSRMPAHSPGM